MVEGFCCQKAKCWLLFVSAVVLFCGGCVGAAGSGNKSSGSSNAPAVTITSPASGAAVSGTITVTTSVSANTISVQLKADGANVGAAVASAPFPLSLDTTTLANGNHSLTAVASDSAGQTTTSAAVSIKVSNTSGTPPSVSITSPSSGATVSGTIAVTTNVSANTISVQLKADGANVGAAVTSAPFSLSLNTTTLANGSHTLTAVASDAAGQTAASAAVSILVSNGGLTPSGPITISGQTGTVIKNLHVSNPNGDCVTITNSSSITLEQSEIGPCSGNGVVINGGDTISVLDNYIHPEGALAGCCDVTDGIFASGSSNLTIQGNVIAYGEANIEANIQTNLKVVGNFLLNPRGGANSRGQNVQVWNNSTTVLVQNNYGLSSTDTTVYAFAELQEDSINFGADPGGPYTNGVVAQNNYVTGGHSNSGCGIIADTGANSVQFLTNVIIDSGQCGIGIADGTNQVVDSNKILNTTPVIGGGNTAVYVWKVTSSDPPCGPVQISNNIASAVDTNGNPNSFFSGGGCGTVTLTNNTFDAAAAQMLSPAAQKLPPPAIPPLPAVCVMASPFSNNTAFPPCG